MVARLSNPRTGEEWSAPILAGTTDDLGLTNPYDTTTYVVVLGHRQNHDIVVLVRSWPDVPGEELIAHRSALLGSSLFEIHDGTLIEVPCPSSTQTCDDGADGTTPSIFYDSLTVPQTLRLEGIDYTVTLPHWMPVSAELVAVADAIQPGSVAGNWWWSTNPSDTHVDRLVTDSGFEGAARLTEPTQVSGVSATTYALQMPNGGWLSLSAPAPRAVDYNAIIWDDGQARSTGRAWSDYAPTTVPAAGGVCSATHVAHVVTSDAAGAWVRAGVLPDGRVIRVPAPGAHPLAEAIYERSRSIHAATDWGDSDRWLWSSDPAVPSVLPQNPGERPPGASYAWDSYEQWRDDFALVSVDSDDGRQELWVRADAAHAVLEGS